MFGITGFSSTGVSGRVSKPSARPALVSATVSVSGGQLQLVFDLPVRFGTDGNTGFAVTLNGGAASLTYVSGAGTPVLNYSISRTVVAGETGTFAYTQAGNGVLSDAGLVTLPTFSGSVVSNNSAQVPPVNTSRSIASSGTQITLGFSEIVQFGAGGNGGFTLTMSGGAVTLTYLTGAGTFNLVYNLSRPIVVGETGTLAYTQPGSGVVSQASGLSMVSVSGQSVTNGSGVTAPVFTTTPSITGTPTVGAAVAYTQGNVTGNPSPTRTRQWTLDGVDISGATSTTYTPVVNDGGKTLRVRETATNTVGAVSSTSAGVLVSAGSDLTWLDNVFPMSINRNSFFDLAPHISDPSKVAAITPNVALPSGVAITNSPTWRVTATGGATLGVTSGLNLTLVPNAAADWVNRISGAGVVWYHSFDAASEVNQFRWTNGFGQNSGNDPQGIGDGGQYVTWQASGGADGGPFMRLTYPVGSASGRGNSYWARPFYPMTGAANGRGVADPGASGALATQGFTTLSAVMSQASNPGWYGPPTKQAANPSKFQGNDYFLQVRARRAQNPGPPPDTAQYTSIGGKFVWLTTTGSSFVTGEIVTFGQSASNPDVTGTPSIHNGYTFTGDFNDWAHKIGGTTSINNFDGINDWRYSGGWDTLLYHITPGEEGGTGNQRTHMEVWAQHDLTLFPAEAGQYTKIWDTFFPAAYQNGTDNFGGIYPGGWNCLILAIYHNGSAFLTSQFNFDYDQVIFSKATIPAPTA